MKQNQKKILVEDSKTLLRGVGDMARNGLVSRKKNYVVRQGRSGEGKLTREGDLETPNIGVKPWAVDRDHVKQPGEEGWVLRRARLLS